MKAHWKYLKYVLRHKWFVFLECLKLGVPLWIAITHDWDKFMPDEWFAFVNHFYGEKIRDGNWSVTDLKTGQSIPKMIDPPDVQEAWDQALNLHYNRNRHHWQFYLFRPDKPRPQFGQCSYDGGMSHATVTRYGEGGDAAIIYDISIPWFKPNWDAVKQLDLVFKMTPVLKKMPDVYAREMLADWCAMSRANGGDVKTWYLANRTTIFLHPETQAWIEAQIGVESSRQVAATIPNPQIDEIEDDENAYADSEWDPDETVYEDDDWEDPNEAIVPGSMAEVDFDDASDDDPSDYDS
jgi:hypothetical protein